ncbi:sensor histidine kinase [Methanocella arvoryzae]|uniref:Signal transduction histidine kinase n=1 Tax=Methanocella arvoryzae (strain DSM 22066 / NBRC 105507 / MRE50) TaxID=351160 RepID=Q0W3Y4_METAR|nr:GAF domain-containing sensor histidine kinase [Methanocella arvoryzae]CAJ36909.1 putative signal transduction histidine kinase [Methanocella arvoryzae MRE50]
MSEEGKSYEELEREIANLKRQVSELQDAAHRQKASEEDLKLDEARLEALLRLGQLGDASEQDIANFALEECIRLTGSEIGWMGALDYKKGVVNLYNYSSKTLQRCNVLGMPHSYVLESGGIWAEPIRQRKAIILNDFAAPHPAKKGFPPGHLQLKNFLAVPVFDDNSVVALAEVANKDGDYNHSDARQLTLLMDGVWRIILRKRAEKAQQEAKNQAEMYLDLMSHDLNNLNQMTLGFMELALQELDKGGLTKEEHRYLIERPIETLRSSIRLIENVKKLQSAKKGGLKSRVFDLDAILREVVQEYAIVPGRDVKISYTPEEGLFVPANELAKDIFSNIIGNAIKHSPPDRRLEINVRAAWVTEQGKPYIATMIEDNGPGIPDDKKSQLFSRYSCGPEKRYKGGLGLELVQTLVSDFGGRVWVENRIAGDYTKGCRFVVILPAAGR